MTEKKQKDNSHAEQKLFRIIERQVDRQPTDKEKQAAYDLCLISYRVCEKTGELKRLEDFMGEESAIKRLRKELERMNTRLWIEKGRNVNLKYSEYENEVSEVPVSIEE